MRPLRLLSFYLLAVFLGGALLAPGLYYLAGGMAAHSPALKSLAQNPFHRFVHRSLLMCALIFLWPLLRGLKMNHWRDLGFTHGPDRLKNFGAGFLIGWGSLACLAVLAMACGARQFNASPSTGELLRHFLEAGLTAIIVACLEEVVFRGMLFGALRREHSWPTALVASSAVYALVHFFKRPNPPSEIEWVSGLAVLGQMLGGFVDLQMLIPGFFTLLLGGASLALAYQRTTNLFCSIGLHAGWIFWLKFYGFISTNIPGASKSLWGTEKIVDGWVGLGVLVLVLFLFLRQPQQAKAGIARPC